MDIFLKAAAGILIAVVLGLALAKQGKDISILLVIAVCCMVLIAAVSYLQPVIEFFDKLEDLGNLNSGMLSILLKAVGIGLLTEITALICTDAGNAAMGKALQILSAAVILCISVPMFTELIELVENILGAL